MATPSSSEPRIRAGSSSASPALRVATTSLPGRNGSGGRKLAPPMRAHTYTKIIRVAPIITPGTMPATNRRPMDSPVTSEYTMNEMLGGMMTPMVHEASVSAVAKETE